MKECCDNCKHKARLIKYDYTHGGCEHTDYEGFACVVFLSEGVVVHMVGVENESGMCECFTER